MKLIEKYILESMSHGKKLFAWLIDPDKSEPKELEVQLKNAVGNPPSMIFLGGSLMIKDNVDQSITYIKKYLNVPVILFPGSTNQINDKADGLLFLSLISGRNPDFLIGRHVEAAALLKNSNLEVLPTGYMLVDCGKPTTASYISNTFPLPYNKYDIAVSTAIAGELLGLRFLFVDGGSGAEKSVHKDMISAIRKNTNIPLIVGGGIRSANEMKIAFEAGADIVVVGNSIETNPDLLHELSIVTAGYNKI
jgi:putative glycerol-1-phosphate prenyltransferase